jgi:hypothetical protein
MPMAVILEPLNVLLEDASSPGYADVQAAVEAADTMSGAVEGLGLLDARTDAVLAEARVVFAAVPAAVDEAVMATAENAFARGVPIFLHWVETDSVTIAVRISEEPDPRGDGVRVHIDFLSPHGETFA